MSHRAAAVTHRSNCVHPRSRGLARKRKSRPDNLERKLDHFSPVAATFTACRRLQWLQRTNRQPDSSIRTQWYTHRPGALPTSRWHCFGSDRRMFIIHLVELSQHMQQVASCMCDHAKHNFDIFSCLKNLHSYQKV